MPKEHGVRGSGFGVRPPPACADAIGPHASQAINEGQRNRWPSIPSRTPNPEPRVPGVLLLLRPKWLTARSRAGTTTSGGPARWLVVAVLTGGFWWTVYAVLARVLRYLRDIPDLGPLLAGKLLGMILIGFFGILLLSNVITALSSFFSHAIWICWSAAPSRGRHSTAQN